MPRIRTSLVVAIFLMATNLFGESPPPDACRNSLKLAGHEDPEAIAAFRKKHPEYVDILIGGDNPEIIATIVRDEAPLATIVDTLVEAAEPSHRKFYTPKGDSLPADIPFASNPSGSSILGYREYSLNDPRHAIDSYGEVFFNIEYSMSETGVRAELVMVVGKDWIHVANLNISASALQSATQFRRGDPGVQLEGVPSDVLAHPSVQRINPTKFYTVDWIADVLSVVSQTARPFYEKNKKKAA